MEECGCRPELADILISPCIEGNALRSKLTTGLSKDYAGEFTCRGQSIIRAAREVDLENSKILVVRSRKCAVFVKRQARRLSSKVALMGFSLALFLLGN